MSILVISGSRADFGLLQPIILKLSGEFETQVLKIWGATPDSAYKTVNEWLDLTKPGLVLILGDRFEILASALACHLHCIPIAHIGGGDTTTGSYDDAMRDCISRLASIHMVTSLESKTRLEILGYTNIHLVGNPAIDTINSMYYAAPHTKGIVSGNTGLYKHALIDYVAMQDEKQTRVWKWKRPITEPYDVISYQAETIFPDLVYSEIHKLLDSLVDRKHVFMLPNQDVGTDIIVNAIRLRVRKQDVIYDYLEHKDFLNLLYYCEEFIGNSSSMLYECPLMGVKVRMIGSRQEGRSVPFMEPAADNILKVLRAS